MHSTTLYSLADLDFDEINLATILNMVHKCVNLALGKKCSSSTSDIKEFIEFARKFHEKKELIFYANDTSLKYQEPILTKEGLIVKQSTESCLSDLKIFLNHLEYDLDHPCEVNDIVSPCLCRHFLARINAIPDAAAALGHFLAPKSVTPPILPADDSETICDEDTIEFNDSHQNQCSSGRNAYQNSTANVVLNAENDSELCEVVSVAPSAPMVPDVTRPRVATFEVIGLCEDRELNVNKESHSSEDASDTYVLDIFPDVQNIELIDVQYSDDSSGSRCVLAGGSRPRGDRPSSDDGTSTPPILPHPAPTIQMHSERNEQYVCTEIIVDCASDFPSNETGSGNNASQVLLQYENVRNEGLGQGIVCELEVGENAVEVAGFGPVNCLPPTLFSLPLPLPKSPPHDAGRPSKPPWQIKGGVIIDKYPGTYEFPHKQNVVEDHICLVLHENGTFNDKCICIGSPVLPVSGSQVGEQEWVGHLPSSSPPLMPVISQFKQQKSPAVGLPNHHTMGKSDEISFPSDITRLFIKESRVAMVKNVACSGHIIQNEKNKAFIRPNSEPPDIVSLAFRPTNNQPATEYMSSIKKSSVRIYEDMKYAPEFGNDEKDFCRLGYVHTTESVGAATKISRGNRVRIKVLSQKFCHFLECLLLRMNAICMWLDYLASRLFELMYLATIFSFKSLQKSESRKSLQ